MQKINFEQTIKLIHKEINVKLVRTNKKLDRFLVSAVPIIPKLGNYFFKKRGKQLRPVICLLSSKMINKNYSQIYEMDADFSHPPEKLVNMSKKLNSTCDVVVGSRYYDGIRVKNWPKSRVLLSRAASLYVRFITGLPIMDPTAGFVGYKLKVLKEIDLRKINFKGYAFQIALKFHSWRKGFIIKELPITFTDRIHGESKMNISIIGEAIFGILLMKIKSFFKK